MIGSLHELPLTIANDHDIVINLASAGVAHKDANGVDILTANLNIARRVCLFAAATRKRTLLHLGSDTEQAHQITCADFEPHTSTARGQGKPELTMYSLSKAVQSMIIRYYSFELGLDAHVIRCPNIYGGDDPPLSLLGTMKAAAGAGQPFSLRNPKAQKRFMHISAFSSHLISWLQDLGERKTCRDGPGHFEMSSIDFVRTTTVASFARQQWELLGADRSLFMADDISQQQ